MTATSSYVGLSAQLALERKLETIAHNVANAGTAGFRAARVDFGSVVSKTGVFATTFAVGARDSLDVGAGGLEKTGNPLDVAIQGGAFLAVETPNGVVYSRDGRMQMLSGGELVTLGGDAVLDSGGAPIVLDAKGETPVIGRDGTILQGERRLGAIGLFSIDLSLGFVRAGNAGLVPAAPAEPVVDFSRDGLVQGFVEKSNVNPVLELSRLIAVSRAFELVSAGIEKVDAASRAAIQALGSSS